MHDDRHLLHSPRRQINKTHGPYPGLPSFLSCPGHLWTEFMRPFSPFTLPLVIRGTASHANNSEGVGGLLAGGFADRRVLRRMLQTFGGGLLFIAPRL